MWSRRKKKNLVEILANLRQPKSNRQKIGILQKLKVSVNILFKQNLKENIEAITSTNQDYKMHSFKGKHDIKMPISAISLGLATTGVLFYPPLSLLSLPGVFFITADRLKKDYQLLVKNKKVHVDLLFTIIVVVGVVQGYFWVVNFQLFLGMCSRYLAEKIKSNSKEKIIDIFGQQPNHVWVLVDGVEIEIPFESLTKGDMIVAQAGSTIPVDGHITDGVASIDQHMLTVEYKKFEKWRGDQVYALTVVLAGKIYIEVEKTGQETTAAQIGKILSKTVNFKTDMQIEEASDRAVSPLLVVSGLSVPVLGPMGAVALLNSHPKYKITIATYIDILRFFEQASQNGLLIKDGRVFELLNQVDTVVFDKTGTLTQEQPHVGQIYTCNGYRENDVLVYAATAFVQSHPIAKAILREAETRELRIAEREGAEYKIGYGLVVTIADRIIRVGSEREMEGISIPPAIKQSQETCHLQGHTLIPLFADDHTVLSTFMTRVAAVIHKQHTNRQDKQLLLAELAGRQPMQQQRAAFLPPVRYSRPAHSLVRVEPEIKSNVKHYAALVTTKLNLLKSALSGKGPLLDHLAILERDGASQVCETTSMSAPMSKAERAASRDLAFALTMVGVMSAGYLLYPPLLAVKFLGSLYAIAKNSKYAYHSILKKGKLTLEFIDALMAVGIFLGGYYFSGTVSFAVTSLSRKLMARSEDNSYKDLVNIFGQQPKHVWVAVDEVEVELDFEKLQVGDVVIVGVGQMIPIDGIINKGTASVDQHVLTGEAQPVEKGVGDSVLASTVVLSGKLYIQVEKTGSETTAAQISTLLEQTTDFKQSIQTRSEVINDAAVLPTLALSAIALPFGGVNTCLGVLESSIGYSLRLTGPISMLNFLKLASQQGILIKDGRSLEVLKQVNTIVFDKTGTLTQEQPHVHRIYALKGDSEEHLLALAAAAETRMGHPIARAIVEAAKQRGIVCPPVEDAHYQLGYGLQVTVDKQVIRVGSERFMRSTQIDVPAEVASLQSQYHAQGCSVVMIAIDEQLAGVIILQPTVRPEAAQIVNALHQRGLSTYIISGDQEEPTRQLAEELGIDHYFANTLPEQKADLVEKLQQEGRIVCFIGDGINDSIALKTANVSVSIQGATSVATDTAQIILMDKSLRNLNALFEIGQEFDANMQVNVATAVLPGIITIGGVFLFHMGFMSSAIIYTLSLLFGGGNAMLPLFTKGRNRKKKEKS